MRSRQLTNKRWQRGFRRVGQLWLVVLASLNFGAASLSGNEQLSPESVEFFEDKIRPLLVDHCLECHSAQSDSVGGNLRLDHRNGWVRGGDLGPAIVRGAPDESLLVQAVRHTHASVQMPPDGKLSRQQISLLEQWVRIGAPDPRVPPKSRLQDEADNETFDEARRDHWAFQSPHATSPQIPTVGAKYRQWSTNEIDLFVSSKLEARGLTPSAPAPRRTLIRRASFDLTGLPPTPDEIQTFLKDARPDAYERMVDRLLNSPRYGERWGRFWLDVARYADSNGLDENIAHGNAWRYRDYVVSAFNQDKPYNEFILEQLAGDLLPQTSNESIQRARIIATGFLSLGPKVLAEVDETKMEMDIIDEQVETVGRAFMGLTLGCARCHDHKFDPISIEDYYALAGIFKSTRTMEHFRKIARWNETNIASDAQRERHAAHTQKVEATRAAIQQLKNRESTATQEVTSSSDNGTNKTADPLSQLQQLLRQLEASTPELPQAMAVSDYDEATDLRVHIRGSFLTQGKLVPRRFPSIFLTEVDKRAAEQASPQHSSIATTKSGRLELARWLVDGRHPLVARVMVNRVWRWHFGQGLVKSTDNFGLLGDRPNNQPLLDWLAVRFVDQGWSIKHLHRLIMCSATYRQSVAVNDANAIIDQDNRYQWRSNVRRLEAEAIRDAVLYVSGQLDLTMRGSLLHVGNREFLFDHTSKDTTNYESNRRSLYLPVIRNHLFDAFQLFDYSDASVMSSNRTTTTVAPQALFMMNSKLVSSAADSFAKRVVSSRATDRSRVSYAYELAFGRPPTDGQMERALEYLSHPENGSGATVLSQETVQAESKSSMSAWLSFCQALLMSNEFIYLN